MVVYEQDLNPWLLCPQCFRVFRASEKFRPAKWCPYPDCKWDKESAPYTIDYRSLRLLNPHLPREPERGVRYVEGTNIAIPYDMSEAELTELEGKSRS